MTLLDLAKLLRKHLGLMIALPLLCAVLAVIVCWGFLPNEYTASVSMYVLAKSDDSTTSVSSTDLSTSQLITNDVAVLIESDRVLSDTEEALGLDGELEDDYELTVESDTDTRVLTLQVTGNSAEGTAEVANQVAESTDAVAQEIMDVEAVNIIDYASVPEEPSGPSRLLYTAVAFCAGLFLAIAIIIIQDMLDTRVSSPEEAEELLGMPVIGRIPTLKS